MITIEDIEIWINENGDSEGFYDTEALVNHFVNISKVELIKKACKQLKTMITEITYRTEDSIAEHYDIDEFIEDFKQAMMEN